MPDKFTSGRRARILSETARTRYASIFQSTRAGYNAQVIQFVDFCHAMGRDPQFDDYDLICCFFQYYVAGVDGERKIRATTAPAKFLSAWKSFALEHDLPYPALGSHLRLRVNRFVQGLKNRYPHVPAQDVPLCIDGLALIGADMGIHSVNDLFTCDAVVLSRWSRLLTAHDACLRATEHSHGCRVSDVTDCGGFLTILVGSRVYESKRKDAPRLAVLWDRVSHLSSGYVLRILFQRVHKRVIPKADAVGTHRRAAPGPRYWRGDVPDITEKKSRSATPGIARDPILFPQCAGKSPLTAESAKLLKEAVVRASLRCGIAGINTLTCLRAGGATDFFAKGMPRWWICKQGGWSSSSTAVDIYNRPTPTQRAAVAIAYEDSVLTLAAAGRPI